MSYDQSSFHVIDLKLDIEPSLTSQRRAAANEVAARCVTALARLLTPVYACGKPRLRINIHHCAPPIDSIAQRATGSE